MPPSYPAERVRWRREQALSPASQAELEELLGRAAALLEAAGIRRVPGRLSLPGRLPLPGSLCCRAACSSGPACSAAPPLGASFFFLCWCTAAQGLLAQA